MIMAGRYSRSVAPVLGLLVAVSIGGAALRAQMSDEAIRDRVAYRVETSPAVKKYDITVKVDRHNVRLTGDVATEAQKAEAGKLARVEGVDKVDNEITVDRNADVTLADRAKRGMRRSGEAIDDTWITTKVKWFFTGDSLLKGSNISVTTDHRVVELTGKVPTEAGRRRAVALATDTDGVTKVVDHLTIGR
jgi:osmotically-inducible protein OsmY